MTGDSEELSWRVSYGVGFLFCSGSSGSGTTHLLVGASGLYPHGLHFRKRIFHPPPLPFLLVRDVSTPIGEPQTGHGVLYKHFGTKLSD